MGGAQCAMHALSRYPNSKLLIVVPTRQIKRGWERTLKRCNIFYASKPSEIARDKQAIITTYAGAKDILIAIDDAIGKPKLVIVFDEFHHMEGIEGWAAPFLAMTSEDYVARIFLSGTPWHEQGDICMVSYVKRKFNETLRDGSVVSGEEDVVDADFEYPYGKNVNATDGDRNTVAIRFVGEWAKVTVERRDRETDQIIDTYTISTEQTVRSDPITDFVRFGSYAELMSDKFAHVRALIDQGVAYLIDQRKRIANLGGIIFVSGREEGQAVEEYMQRRHSLQACFVISDDPKSHNKIEEFANPKNHDEWIIAIDMIAEGADIPRLKVAVDLSWKTTMLHIIQRWGRILRMMRNADHSPVTPEISATVFFFDHAQLRYVSNRIEAEMHRNKGAGGGDGPPPPPMTTYTEVIDSEHGAKDRVFKGGNIPVEIDTLALWLIQSNHNGIGSQMSYESALWVARNMVLGDTVPDSYHADQIIVETFSNGDSPSDPDAKSQKERWEDAKKEIKRAGTELAMEYFDGDYAAAGFYVNTLHGVNSWSEKHKTVPEMEERVAVIHHALVAQKEMAG